MATITDTNESRGNLCTQFLEILTRNGGTWEAERSTGNLMPFNGKPKFQYGVQMRFWRRPEKTPSNFVLTSTRSWPAGVDRDEKGMHYDMGFMRCNHKAELEWNIASNNGAVEVVKGKVVLTNMNSARAVLLPAGVLNLGDRTATKRVLEMPVVDTGKPRQFLLHEFYMPKTEGDKPLVEHLRDQMMPVPPAPPL
uniref:THAP4-like heme-binding domain-containing protein n=1 Tax=Neobodo designis TaxID=312471 RepID=A0A7S1KWV5_NEODS|mmetsp:Transcript_10278/g.31776  ORF Transcript_10278/g.31776 Transcript_10278/m.31776 type:complete len:195 (+) Transcript_10278:39-623(+)|eukprot:CAMPEP_0174871574 /NCGR_PEP_ID=MMETSP1114-20130205/71759_1 /TAXON_ID=312471 /ORGANISM="Neobodo designis, Strain CCAP 1951/1" /LENGTH=194 /DNA_ID=CAMNT_0016106859 /DNA_START=32 /DNA_END=616 /DNA_ORIENTATION=+